MTRREKARRIGEILDSCYPRPEPPLAHRDPFTLLVAVAISAQTTDAQVNQVTPALFERAATAAQLAGLAEEEILGCIRACGLAPTKARRLKRLGELLVERHGGQVPAEREALQELPGVGRKTASVVLVQAFGIPAFPVDTHIHRLAARWGLSSGRSVACTEQDLQQLYPPSEWGRRHLQIIYFGRDHCPARGHRPGDCPICSWAGSG
jgi:endonuclease III